MRIGYLTSFCLLALALPAAADDTVDWLLRGDAATTRPALLPATQPTSPSSAATTRPLREGSRRGVVTLSSGASLRGEIATTPGKPIRLWQESLNKYADIPLAAIHSIEAVVLWERDEQEWHFIASGSDLKEYTGRTYPARETAYKVRVGDTVIEGGTVWPLYIQTPEGEQMFVLHKRDKGPIGGTLKGLVYVKSIEFDD